jgi:amidase
MSVNQDTVGTMTRSVKDAAIALSIIVGKDRKDNHTLSQPPTLPNFVDALDKNGLKGKRIGVPRKVFFNQTINSFDSSIGIAFEKALKVMQMLGATIIDPADLPSAEEMVISMNETLVVGVDFKVSLPLLS